MEFPGSWMKTPQDFHCSGVSGLKTDSGTEIIYFPCLWSCLCLWCNPRLLWMMKTSLHAYLENSANMDTIRKDSTGCMLENCIFHTLNEEGGLRTQEQAEACFLNGIVGLIKVSLRTLIQDVLAFFFFFLPTHSSSTCVSCMTLVIRN